MTVTRFKMPLETALDDLGVTIPGATLTFYEGLSTGTGTTTKQDTFSDLALTIENPNPITAGDDGRFETIFLQEKLYRVVYEDEENELIWDVNPVNSEGQSSTEVRRVFFFTGDGVTTAFDTLQGGLPTEQINYDISIQGIAQKKDADTYSISGTVVNFVAAPPDTMLVEIVVTQPVSSLAGLEFVNLDDTPSDYTGAGGSTVRVNSAEDALEFSAIPLAGDGSELTIASGVITVTTGYHTVDTEADAATDDLNTINGTSKGEVIILGAASGSRTIVLKDNVGNLKLPSDVSLNSLEDSITLLNFDGTNLKATSIEDNG